MVLAAREPRPRTINPTSLSAAEGHSLVAIKHLFREWVRNRALSMACCLFTNEEKGSTLIDQHGVVCVTLATRRDAGAGRTINCLCNTPGYILRNQYRSDASDCVKMKGQRWLIITELCVSRCRHAANSAGGALNCLMLFFSNDFFLGVFFCGPGSSTATSGFLGGFNTAALLDASPSRGLAFCPNASPPPGWQNCAKEVSKRRLFSRLLATILPSSLSDYSGSVVLARYHGRQTTGRY